MAISQILSNFEEYFIYFYIFRTDKCDKTKTGRRKKNSDNILQT